MKRVKIGIDNFIVFQRYPFFRWPAWVERDESISPPVLLNKTLNQWACFSNFNSSNELRIDDFGMITSSYGAWALEFWLVYGGKLYRSVQSSEYHVEKNPLSSVVSIVWKEKHFTLHIVFAGSRMYSEEAFCKAELNLIDSTRHAELLAVVRPYNNNVLASVSSIDYDKSTGLVKIDGCACIKLESAADLVMSNSGVFGDIDPESGDAGSPSVRSAEGMASLGLAVATKKKSAAMLLRISLNGRDIKPNKVKISFDELMAEFERFTAARVWEDGVKLKMPDKLFSDWFYSVKASMVSLSETDYLDFMSGIFNFKNAFYYARALHRMGCFADAAQVIKRMKSNLKYNAKKPVFGEIINCCYFLCAVVDSFVHTRDEAYLGENFQPMKDIAQIILKYSSGLSSFSGLKEKQQSHFLFGDLPCLDFTLMAAALAGFAYFARCKGIFGDEKKFTDESARLQKIIAADEGHLSNEFFFLMVFTGYPFNLPYCRDAWEVVLARIEKYSHGKLLKIKSIGLDLFSSLIVANNMLAINSRIAFGIYYEIEKTGGKRYCLPEFADERNKRGVWGNGASKICSGEMFSLLRNMIFIDMPERLSIFPVPKKEWFSSGKEFVIENAPSRFGYINFRYDASENDIIFRFEALPKFVPPEIVITLPYSVKIHRNDDFILKKTIDNKTYVINGWPPFIKFTRS